MTQIKLAENNIFEIKELWNLHTYGHAVKKDIIPWLSKYDCSAVTDD